VSKALKARLLRGLSANALSQIIRILIQLVSVPILLSNWGVSLYGEWLTLNAIPWGLTVSDLGFGTAAANEMTMLVAEGKRDEALEVFQSISLLVSLICSLILSLALSVIWLTPFKGILQIEYLSASQVAFTLTSLTAYGLLILTANSVVSISRCAGNYALGTTVITTTWGLEWLAALSLVVAGHQPPTVALAFLIVRALGLSCLWAIIRRKIPWLVLGWRFARWSVIQRLTKPALAFLGMPLGMMLSNQGMITILSITLGSQGVAVFSTLRTLARFILQLATGISNSVWAELSSAYGAGNLILARKLHRRACQASLWLSGLGAVLLYAAGPWLLYWWTHGQIAMDSRLFATLLAAVVTNALWLSSSVALTATNHHQRMMVQYVLGICASLGVALLLTPKLGLFATATAILLTELGMAISVIYASLRLLDDHPRKFLISLMTLPRLLG
jgi:O-antigen/teichoic acid export membrane protein